MGKRNYLNDQLKNCKTDEERAYYLNKAYQLFQENFLDPVETRRYEKRGNAWYRISKIDGQENTREGVDLITDVNVILNAFKKILEK